MMSTNDERCVYRYSSDPDAGLCHAPREDHKRLSHAFVEPAPAGPPVTATTGDDYNGFWPLAVRMKEDFDRLVNTARSDEWKRVIGNVRDWVQEADRDEQPQGATLLGLAEALGTDTSYLLGTTRTFEQIVDAVGTLPTTGLATAGPPVTGDGDEAVVREIVDGIRGLSEVMRAAGMVACRAGLARGRALEARDASFNNDWFCSTECMGYTRDDIDKGFCVYCAAPVARDGERKP
jgi:hypothetical protein